MLQAGGLLVLERYDLVVLRRVTRQICIVGGGPAGLGAAIALHQEGFRVAVTDCATPPIDKACGEGLLPSSLAALQSLGIRIPAGLAHPFYGIQFIDERSRASARFRGGPALGIRRTLLHSLLVERALEIGVDLRWGSRQDGCTNWDLVIGADGGNSRVRQQAGLNDGSTHSHRYAFRQHFQVAPWSSYVDVHWSARSQLYVTPIGPEEVGIAVISHDRMLRLREALSDFPEVQNRLIGALPLSAERGALSTMRSLRSVCNRSIALVGDASGSVDAITGEGLGLAFRQALALAKALRQGDLDSYSKAHRQISRKTRFMAHTLLTLDAHPTLRKYAIAGLAACPAIFSALLAFHAGEAELPDLELVKELNADVPVVIP